jgi:probable HAF family extracellular repeat protein
MRVPALAALSVCLLEASPIYHVVDLGSLGGGASAATALNASGTAVGWSYRPDLSRGAVTPTGLAAGESVANGINSTGRTVGVQYDVCGHPYAVVFGTDKSVTRLAGADSYAMAINDAGVAAGAVSGGAVRFTPDGRTVSVGVSAQWSSAYAINAAGAVAGTAMLASGQFRAFSAADGGAVRMLGTLGGGSSYGQDLNDSGWVVGGSTVAAGYLHAFLWAGGNGKLKDLGTLGGKNSSAYGINGSGLVVGYSQVAGGESSAFLWQNGVMKDLNTLLAEETGWRLQEASAINDRGQIVGFGLYQGQQRAFRLDPVETEIALASVMVGNPNPVPEPSTWVMVAVGLAGIGLSLIRRPSAGDERTTSLAEVDPSE